MKKFFFPFLLLVFVLSCSKDTITENSDILEERGIKGKVTVCHKNGQGVFHPISISANALAAHLAHGDYNPDADGDGHTAPGSCTGDGLDCDDHNPEVWENCCEEDCQPVVSVQLLNCIGGWANYLTCPEIIGAVEGVVIFGQNAIISALKSNNGIYSFFHETSTDICFYAFNELTGTGTITLEQWQESRDEILNYIDSHPALLNSCENNGLVSRADASLKFSGNNAGLNSNTLPEQVKSQIQDLKSKFILNKEQ